VGWGGWVVVWPLRVCSWSPQENVEIDPFFRSRLSTLFFLKEVPVAGSGLWGPWTTTWIS